MYQEAGAPTNHYDAGLLFASDDGVHWRDVAPVARSEAGTQWWKGFVLQRADGSYVMNHGVYEGGKNDALRILTCNGTDKLTDWQAAATSRPGAAYHANGRWDHMYMNVDDTSGGPGGYIGFAVSSPLNRTRFASGWPGVQRSRDGVHWTAGQPLAVEWGALTPQSIEEGGFERLQLPPTATHGAGNRSKWFLVGGGGAALGGMSYCMWVFEADEIDGPYRPVARRFRLSGGGSGGAGGFSWGALAAFVKGRDGARLVSQYMTAQGKGRANVWMLPMRQPVLDTSGALRLGWWPGNEAMLGGPVAGHSTTATAPPQVLTAACAGAGGGASVRVAWLAALDAATHDQGVYLRAQLSSIGATGAAGAVGVAIEDPASNASAPPGPGPADPSYAVGFDLPGDDLRWHAANYSDPRVCMAECAAEPACVAWTFVLSAGRREGAGAGWGTDAGYEYPVPRCCLKGGGGLPSFRHNSACVSGLSRSLPPTPSPAPRPKALTAALVDVGADGAAGTASRVWRGASATGGGGGGAFSELDRSGIFACGAGGAKCGVGTVTAVSHGDAHDLLLLLRKGMWELYIDGLLVQTYVYGSAYPLPPPGAAGVTGRVGVACSGNATASLSQITLGLLKL
eukprot:g527.t1